MLRHLHNPYGVERSHVPIGAKQRYYDFNSGRWIDGLPPGGGNYNPQQTATVQQVQPAARAPYYQPARTTPYYQNTYSPQRTAPANHPIYTTHAAWWNIAGRQIRANTLDQANREYARIVAEERARELAKQKAEQRGIFDRIKKGVSDTLKGAKDRAEHLLGTPGRYFGALVDRYEARLTSESSQGQANKDIEWWQNKYTGQANDAWQRYYNREISYDAAAAQEARAWDALQKAGARWDKYFSDLEARRSNPITGGFMNALKFAGKVVSNPVSRTVWKYTLGPGDRGISFKPGNLQGPSLATLPDRFLKYGGLKGWWGSGQHFSERPPTNVPPRGQAPLEYRKGYNAWQQTYNTTYGNLRDDILNDPLTWAAGLGARNIGSRVVQRGPGWLQKAAGVGRYQASPSRIIGQTVSRNIPKGVRDAVAWQKGTPGDRALQWLKSERTTKGDRIKQKYDPLIDEEWARIKRLGSKMSGFKPGTEQRALGELRQFNKYEFEALQRALYYKGEVPAIYQRHPRVDVAKIQRWIDRRAPQKRGDVSRYGRMQAAESRVGVHSPFYRGYVPQPRSTKFADEVSSKRGDKITYGFQKKREEFTTGDWPTREQFASAAAKRERQHLTATGKNPLDRWGAEMSQRRLNTFKLEDARNAELAKWKGSFGYKAGRFARAPTKLAKLAWLRFNPAWYLNNVLHSAAVTGASGGPGALLQAGKYALRPGKMKLLPEEVAGGQVAGELGSKMSGRFGPYTENIFRSAIYKSAQARGLSKGEAIKEVNRHMFDYGTLKNWERPLQTVFPFWRWEKNINRYMAQMPIRQPGFTKGYQAFQNEAIDAPYTEIPQQETASDGTTIEGPRPGYLVDKLKIANKFWTTGGFPMTRGQRDHIGINPIIQAVMGLGGMDAFGSDLKGFHPLEWVNRMFPQANLARKTLEATNKLGVNRPKETNEWYTATYNTKSQQGFDPTAPNYNEKYDVVLQFKNQLESFLGVRNFDFDENKFRENLRFQGFMRDYIDQPWEREKRQDGSPLEYDEKQARREAIAKKWGFDLERDIYEGRFAKNDTQFTYIQKQAEKRTREMQQVLYDAYYAIPKGKRKGTGNRTEKLEEIRQMLADKNFRQKYPKIRFWPNTDWVNNQRGGYGTGQKGGSRSFRKGSSTAVFRYGKWFKSEATAARYGRYLAYRSGPKGQRRFRGADPRKKRIWEIYNDPTINPDERRRLLAAEGLSRIASKRTAAEWQQWRAEKAVSDKAKLTRDESRIAQLSPFRQAAISQAVTSSKRKPPTIGKPIKVLTFGAEFR